MTLELSALEVNELIRHHYQFGTADAADHEHESELFHKVRASYLRQRLGAVARRLDALGIGGVDRSAPPV